MCAIEESTYMVAQSENLTPTVFAFVATDTLEGTETIVQSVRKHVHVGIVPVNELSI